MILRTSYKIIIVIFALCVCVYCDAAENRCIVCDVPVTEDKKHVVYRGVSYPVCSGNCLKDWEHAIQKDRLDPIVFKVDPRGALFQGDSKFLNLDFQKAHPLSDRWLWVGIGLVAAIVSGGFSAALAIVSHRSGIIAFIIGLLLPGFGVPIIKLLPGRSEKFELRGTKIPTTHSECYCSKCNHPCHPSSEQCMSCGASLTPEFESEVLKVNK